MIVCFRSDPLSPRLLSLSFITYHLINTVPMYYSNDERVYTEERFTSPSTTSNTRWGLDCENSYDGRFGAV